MGALISLVWATIETAVAIPSTLAKHLSERRDPEPEPAARLPAGATSEPVVPFWAQLEMLAGGLLVGRSTAVDVAAPPAPSVNFAVAAEREAHVPPVFVFSVDVEAILNDVRAAARKSATRYESPPSDPLGAYLESLESREVLSIRAAPQTR